MPPKPSTLKSLKPGDVVILVWRDHYRVHDRPIKGEPGLVESFGRVSESTDEGVGIFQNRVTNAAAIGAEECMDGQFVLACDIDNVTVIA